MPTEHDDESPHRSQERLLVTAERMRSPLPPARMTTEDVDQARRQAAELVSGVRSSTGGRQLAVLDEVTSVGVRSQRNAGRQLELVKTRLGAYLQAGGPSKEVATNLIDLRTTLDRINPDHLERGLWRRLMAAVPFLGDNVMVRSLKRAAMRYEPVSKQITVIEARLREGRSLLARDNVELRRLYEDVESQHDAVERQAFLGELLLAGLEDLLAETDDPLERDRIQAAMHDVATRVQDLRTMQEVHTQYFVSIELTRQNNNRLAQAVERTLALATNVVTVGLAIQAALIREQSVREATERTQHFLGEVITQNAASIRRLTEEIGDVYNQPVIALDRLTAAHHDLLAALEAAGRAREEGITTARRNIEALTVLTRELADHVTGVEESEAQGLR